MTNPTTGTLMVLTDEEVGIIRRHRANLARIAERNEKQKYCDHNWRFGGHGHNDDWYDCTLCGATKEV